MGNKRSACLYIDREVLETSRRMGLNVSKVSENALVEAVSRLGGPETGTGLRGPPRPGGWGRGRDSNPGARLHRPDNNDGDGLLSGFYDFCRVDLGLSEATAKEYRRKMRRFFRAVGKPAERVTSEDVRRYLKPLAGGNANSYGNALKPIKRFFRDYVRKGDVVGSFKFRRFS